MLGLFRFTVKNSRCRLRPIEEIVAGRRAQLAGAEGTSSGLCTDRPQPHANAQMSFGTKYELLDQITTGRVRSYVARLRASGERVLVHLFSARGFAPGEIELPGTALQHLCRIAPQPPGEPLDCGEYEGTHDAFLVTAWPKYAGHVLRWADQYKSMPDTTAGEGVREQYSEVALESAPPRKAGLTANIDQLLAQPDAEPVRTPLVNHAPAAPAGGTSIFGSGQQHAEQSRPDIFEELFGSSAKQVSPSTPPPPAKGTSAEFASLFGQAAPASDQSSSAPAPTSGDAPQQYVPPGEVLRRHRALTQTETPRSQYPVPPPAPPARAPGEFTKLFSAPLQPSPAAGGAPASPAPQGEFTKLFAAPGANHGAPTPVAPSTTGQAPPVPSAPPPESDKTPGEFTSFFSSPFSPSAQKESPAASPVSPSPRHKAGGFPDLFEPPMKSKAVEKRFEAVPLRREPGAFTRIFGAPHIPEKAPPPATMAPPAAEPVPSAPEAGSAALPPLPPPPPKPFMAAAPAPAAAGAGFPSPPSPTAPAAPEAPHAPSEFTRVVSGRALQEALHSASVPTVPTPAPAVPAPMPVFSQPMVTPPAVAAPQAMPPVVTPPQFSAPYVTPPSVTPPAVTPPTFTPPVVQPPQAYVPTPMPFPAPQYAPVPVPAPVATPPQPPVAKKTNYLPLIVILNVLFILAVALVLFFALKH